jgi:hypothetical protein
MSVVEQGAQAELIVRGRVARVEGRWNGDRSAIYSDVAFAVDDTLKGALPATAARRREVVFRVLGGEVGGVRWSAPATPCRRWARSWSCSCAPTRPRRRVPGSAGAALPPRRSCWSGRSGGPTPSAPAGSNSMTGA